MAKVLLVNPPFYRSLGSHYNGLSLGIAYISAYLNYYGHDAWLYNADFSPTEEYKSPHGLYSDSDRMLQGDGAIVQECVDAIASFDPDIVGFTCYTATVPIVDRISRALREVMPSVLQLAGGPHATLDADTWKLLPGVDVVIKGEGEEEAKCLATWGESSMLADGWVRASDRIKLLDNNPYPEREKLWSHSGQPMGAAEKAMVDVSSIVTARGCPWRCNYCASQFIWPRVIARGVYSVVREVAYVADHYSGPIHFIDDTFTYNAKRALAIMQGVLDLSVPIRWRCEARADTITPSIAEMMARSGCMRVKMGIESGSERILQAMKKGETLEDIRRGVGILRDVGIPVTAYLMAGYPGETDDDLRKTIAFARELCIDSYSISMVTPYFGTPLYRDALARGIAVDQAPRENFFHQNQSLLLNHNLSPDLIDELWSLGDAKPQA